MARVGKAKRRLERRQRERARRCRRRRVERRERERDQAFARALLAALRERSERQRRAFDEALARAEVITGEALWWPPARAKVSGSWESEGDPVSDIRALIDGLPTYVQIYPEPTDPAASGSSAPTGDGAGGVSAVPAV